MTRSLRLLALAVLLLLAVLVVYPTGDTERVHAQGLTERQILEIFYDATDGPNWEDDQNWNTSADLDSWYGINTDDEGRVTGLSIDGKRLAGEIPPELGQLSSLEFLDLAENRLSGEIPSELGNLTKLKSLRLNDNELSGEIPSELGNLTGLNWLYLFGNQLTGSIPSRLGNLPRLHYLDLSNNLLSGEIPPELGELTRLRNLNLYGNQLTGELPDLNSLRNLTVLSLGSNDLEISWATFASDGPLDLASESRWNDPDDDRSLWFLNLQDTGLAGQIPNWIGVNHTELRWLWLHDNALTGEVPKNLGAIRGLQSLRLHGNMLTGRWESISWWRELIELTVPIDRFVNKGGVFFVVGERSIFLRLALPSGVDPMRTHLRWYRDPYNFFDHHLPAHVRTALIAKIVEVSGSNIVLELRNSQAGNVANLQNIPALVCLNVPSTDSSLGTSEEPALLTHDGAAWKVLAPAELPAVFARAVGNTAICGTTQGEPTLPNTGGAVTSGIWGLVLAILGAATTLAGAWLAKSSTKRVMMSGGSVLSRRDERGSGRVESLK